MPKTTAVKNTTINLRVGSEIKERAGKVLASMGLTFSEAFNLMLHQIDIQRALPFEIVSFSYTPSPETLARIERIENGTAEMVGPFRNFGDFKKSLEEGDDGDEI